ALPDRLRRPRRHHRRRPRAAALPLITALAVPPYRDRDLPVQLLPGQVGPQQGERLPAGRAAVPAAREVPGHLDPRQMRVIPAAPARREYPGRPPPPPGPLPPFFLSPPDGSPPSPAESSPSSSPSADPGRFFSVFRPNTIFCSTARVSFTSASRAAWLPTSSR